MTDTDDMKSSKVIEKLSEGELFEVIGDVQCDTISGVTRVQAKRMKGGQTGWITLKGNAGTIFAEISQKYHVAVREVEVHKQRIIALKSLARVLDVDELFEVIEGPIVETPVPVQRYKVRSAYDKMEGWVNQSSVKEWYPDYKVLVPTPLQDAVAPGAEATQLVRGLVRGEMFEFLEGPVKEGEELRMKGKTKKDGMIGWVTLRDNKKLWRLECCIERKNTITLQLHAGSS